MASYPDTSGYPSNTVVVQQQQPSFVVQPGVRPPDYLVLSIVSVFFCFPMAICAIMFSLNSRSAADANDFVKAQHDGRVARNIGIAAIILSIIIIVVAVAVPLAIAASAVATICTGWNCDY